MMVNPLTLQEYIKAGKQQKVWDLILTAKDGTNNLLLEKVSIYPDTSEALSELWRTQDYQSYLRLDRATHEVTGRFAKPSSFNMTFYWIYHSGDENLLREFFRTYGIHDDYLTIIPNNEKNHEETAAYLSALTKETYVKTFILLYEKDDVEGMADLYRKHGDTEPLHELVPLVKRNTTKDRHAEFARDHHHLKNFHDKTFQKAFENEEFQHYYQEGDIYHMALYYAEKKKQNPDFSLQSVVKRDMDLDLCHGFAFEHCDKVHSPKEFLDTLIKKYKNMNGAKTDVVCQKFEEAMRRFYFNKLFDPKDIPSSNKANIIELKNREFHHEPSRFINNQAELYTQQYPDILNHLVTKRMSDVCDKLIQRLLSYKDEVKKNLDPNNWESTYGEQSKPLPVDILGYINALILSVEHYFYTKEGVFRDRANLSNLPKTLRENYGEFRKRLLVAMYFTVCAGFHTPLHTMGVSDIPDNPNDQVLDNMARKVIMKQMDEQILQYAAFNYEEVVRTMGHSTFDSRRDSSRDSSPETLAETNITEKEREELQTRFPGQPYDSFDDRRQATRDRTSFRALFGIKRRETQAESSRQSRRNSPPKDSGNGSFLGLRLKRADTK